MPKSTNQRRYSRQDKESGKLNFESQKKRIEAQLKHAVPTPAKKYRPSRKLQATKQRKTYQRRLSEGHIKELAGGHFQDDECTEKDVYLRQRVPKGDATCHGRVSQGEGPVGHSNIRHALCASAKQGRYFPEVLKNMMNRGLISPDCGINLKTYKKIHYTQHRTKKPVSSRESETSFKPRYLK